MTTTYGITYGTANSFFSQTLYVDTAKLTSSSFVIVYEGSGGYGQAVLATVSGNSISYSSPATFNFRGTSNIKVTALSTSKFVVTYADEGNSSIATAKVGLVSGGSITFSGLPYTFNSSAVGTYDIDALTATKFVVAYKDNGNLFYGTAIIGTVSGTIISFGNEQVFSSESYADPSVSRLTDTKFVIGYKQGLGVDAGTVIIGDAPVNSITFGAEYSFGGGRVFDVGVRGLTASTFILVYRDVANSSLGTARTASFTGTTITLDDGYTFNALPQYNSVSALSDTKIVISYRDAGDSGKGKSIIGTASGGAINFGRQYVFNNIDTDYVSVLSLDSDKIAIGYQNDGFDNWGYSIIGDVAEEPDSPTGNFFAFF